MVFSQQNQNLLSREENWKDNKKQKLSLSSISPTELYKDKFIF